MVVVVGGVQRLLHCCTSSVWLCRSSECESAGCTLTVMLFNTIICPQGPKVCPHYDEVGSAGRDSCVCVFVHAYLHKCTAHTFMINLKVQMWVKTHTYSYAVCPLWLRSLASMNTCGLMITNVILCKRTFQFIKKNQRSSTVSWRLLLL